MGYFNAPNRYSSFNIFVVVKISSVNIGSVSQELRRSIYQERIIVTIEEVLVSCIIIVWFLDESTLLIIFKNVAEDLFTV